MDSILSEISLTENIKVLYLIILYFIGLFNNLGYSMIFTGAHNLVYRLNEKNLIGLVIMCLVSCDCIILLMNLRFFIGYANKSRITLCCLTSSIAYGIISYSIYGQAHTFAIALSAFAIVGMTSTVGECINLGMLKEFLPKYLAGFSSGTGSSRIAASGL